MITPARNDAGSVLITSIIFGFALFAAVAGYVYLTTQSMKMANRTFHLNSAMNLAEAGVEEGLFALNTFLGSAFDVKDYSAFTDWTKADYDGDGVQDARRTFSYFSSNQGTTGEFTVIVTKWELLTTNTRPDIIVRARSTIAGGGVIEKYVRAATRRRSLLGGGLVSRREIRFVGNFASADSYNADFGPYEYDTGVIGAKEAAEDVTGPAGVPDKYVNRAGNATVASASVGVSLGNADVWGQVYTNGSTPLVGPSGSIADLGSRQGTVDPNRISTDFQANFPIEDVPPSGSTPLVVLPTKIGNEYVLGVPGAPAPVIYSLAAVNLTGNEKMRIVGPVRLILSGDFKATGTNNELIIDNGWIDPSDQSLGKNFDNVFANAMMTRLVDDKIPPLQVWVGGDFELGSGGLTNPSTTPASFQIYGTAPETTSSTGTQSIVLRGGSTNSWWSAAVYAPNADLTINGDKDVFGAFVANAITVSGSSKFHYDESLADKGTGKFGITRWRELVLAAQRTGYTFD